MLKSASTKLNLKGYKFGKLSHILDRNVFCFRTSSNTPKHKIEVVLARRECKTHLLIHSYPTGYLTLFYVSKFQKVLPFLLGGYHRQNCAWTSVSSYTFQENLHGSPKNLQRLWKFNKKHKYLPSRYFKMASSYTNTWTTTIICRTETPHIDKNNMADASSMTLLEDFRFKVPGYCTRKAGTSFWNNHGL